MSQLEGSRGSIMRRAVRALSLFDADSPQRWLRQLERTQRLDLALRMCDLRVAVRRLPLVFLAIGCLGLAIAGWTVVGLRWLARPLRLAS